ncbi:hypothetical protein BH09SUM1_BH09SUM1_27810 [soil metagenome]
MKKTFGSIAAAAFLAVASISTAQITTAWVVKSTDASPPFYLPGSGGTPSNTNLSRGMSYDGVRDRIYITSRNTDAGSAANVAVVDPATGALSSVTHLGAAITGGALTLMGCDVDDDPTAPKLYFSNLSTTTNTSAIKVYRLTDPTNAASLTTVLNTTITENTRIGDTIQVVGSGTSTEIWMASNSALNTLPVLIRATTVDGDNFTITDKFFLAASGAARINLGLTVYGTGASQLIYGDNTGNEPVKVTIGSFGTAGTASFTGGFTNPSNISTSIAGISVYQFNGINYLFNGPAGTVAQPAELWDVTSTPVRVLNAPAQTVTGATNTNGNAGTAFDTVRKRVIAFDQNAFLASFDVSPVLSVADWAMIDD